LVFVNVMTTVWALIFLYGPGHQAGIRRGRAYGRGQASAAAAMAVTILGAALTAIIVQLVMVSVADRLTQAWWRR
jgi:hypothetical protein